MNIVLLGLFVSLVYWLSVIGSVYYCDGKIYKFKIIYLITIFTPLLNTYLAIKWFFSQIIEAIKCHFIRNCDVINYYEEDL